MDQKNPEKVPHGSERRQWYRYSIRMEVLFVNREGLRHFLETGNISLGGIYIISDKEVHLGSRGIFKIIVKFKDEEWAIEATGQVVWIRLVGDHQEKFGMGVQFISIDEQNRKNLEKVINILDAPPKE